MRRLLVTTAVAATAVGGLGLAYAHAQPADPTPAVAAAPAVAQTPRTPPTPQNLQGLSDTSDPNAAAAARGCRAGGVLRRSIHGDLIVAGRQGQFRDVTVDRGTLVSLTDSVITINRPDGKTVEAPVTAQTRFRGKDRANLEAGDHVLVVQSAGTARAVLSPRQDRARPCATAKGGAQVQPGGATGAGPSSDAGADLGLDGVI